MVKSETRRNLLTKLGMGAAAITVMSAAGTAASCRTGSAAPAGTIARTVPS